MPESTVKISPFDTLFSSGEKAVEVSRTFDHKPYKLGGHIDRLYRGLAMLDIDPGIDQDQMADLTRQTLDANMGTLPRNVDWQMLHYVSAGPAALFEIVPPDELKPTVMIQCFPLVNRIGKMANKYTEGTDLVVVEQTAMDQDIVPPQIKSSGRMDHLIARRQAKKKTPGATGVLLDRNGRVTEGTGASLFVVQNGVIQTAPESRVLTGITREMVFDIADASGIPIEEADLSVEDVETADEVFIISTIINQVHARTFEGRTIGNGKVGAITDQIRKAYAEEVGVDFVQQAQDYAHTINNQDPNV